MASELNYVTAAVLRVELGNPSVKDFTDSDLDNIITKSEHFVHVAVGRSTSSPWTSAEDAYELVQRVVLEDAKVQGYGAMDDGDDEKKAAEDSRKYYLNLLLSASAGGTADGSFEKTSGCNNQALDSEPGTFA